MRLFVAAFPPRAVQEACVRIAAPWLALDELRAVPLENIHLTFAFLGERPSDLAGRLTVALRDALAAVPSVDARVVAAGGFPDRARARAAILEVEPGTVHPVATAVTAALRTIGEEPEPRPFRPHLTVGRLRRPTDLPALDLEPLSWRIDEVAIVESLLGRGPARYEVLAAARLQAAP